MTKKVHNVNEKLRTRKSRTLQSRKAEIKKSSNQRTKGRLSESYFALFPEKYVISSISMQGTVLKSNVIKVPKLKLLKSSSNISLAFMRCALYLERKQNLFTKMCTEISSYYT